MKLLDLIPGGPQVRLALKVAGGVAVVILLLVLFFAIRSCASAPARQEAAQAKVGEAVAQGTAGAARDATAITGNTMDAMAATDHQTEVNHEAILSGNGDSDTALRALCMRRAYRSQPGCVALLQPGAVATH